MRWHNKSFVPAAITQKNKGLYTISHFFLAAYLETNMTLCCMNRAYTKKGGTFPGKSVKNGITEQITTKLSSELSTIVSDKHKQLLCPDLRG